MDAAYSAVQHDQTVYAKTEWPGCGSCHPSQSSGGEHENRRAIRPRYWGYALSVASLHRDMGRAALPRVRGWLCGLLYVGHLRQAGQVHTVAKRAASGLLGWWGGRQKIASPSRHGRAKSMVAWNLARAKRVEKDPFSSSL